MDLILEVTTTDEFCCDYPTYAVVELDEELMELLTCLTEEAGRLRRYSGFDCIELFNRCLSFYRDTEEEEEMIGDLECDHFLVVEKYQPVSDYMDIDVRTLRVTRNGFHWRGYYGEIVPIRTPLVTLEDLRKAQAKLCT